MSSLYSTMGHVVLDLMGLAQPKSRERSAHPKRHVITHNSHKVSKKKGKRSNTWRGTSWEKAPRTRTRA